MTTFLVAALIAAGAFVGILILEMLGEHTISRLLDKAAGFSRKRKIAGRRAVVHDGDLEHWLVGYYQDSDWGLGPTDHHL